MSKNEFLAEPQPISAALVGISGMGLYHLISLLDEFLPEEVELRGVIDPCPERCERYPELKERKIPVFPSLREFYQSGRSAELVVISSPTHHHVPQSCEALGRGSYVFCEKPVGATIQEADRLIRTADGAHRWVMIGYQWSFSRAIQSLKSDILKGIFGKPVRLKTLCLWPRDEDYYGKSDWLGRKKDEEGRWVLDSPANNAMAHFLHNLFYILGERTDRSAQPAEVQAELYRAYPIENFDSAACRAFTREGVELLFYASHVTCHDRGPMFSFEFEQATVTYGDEADEILAVSRTGREKRYGSPEEAHPYQKLFEAVESVREPKPVVCGPKAACSQTLCVNGIQESAPEIVNFPESMVRKENGKRRWVKGLEEALSSCYQKGILPGEGNFSWARAGKAFDLNNYNFFPGGAPPEGQET